MISLNKCTFNVLEINTLDEVSIYVPREWLLSVSPYFKSLLSNGCKESHSDHCTLNIESKILLLIFGIINSFHFGEKYLTDNFFTNITDDNICNFVSALTEYQLDGILKIFDPYVATIMLQKPLCLGLVNTICMFKLENAQISLGNLLKDDITIVKLFDYSNVSFEFTELFFESGMKSHFKIFGLWASVHQPTDSQLSGTRLLKHDYKRFINNQSYYKRHICAIIDVVENLKDAANFKMAFFQKLVHAIYQPSNNNVNVTKNKRIHPEGSRKRFIADEITSKKSNNSDINNIELLKNVKEKWQQRKLEIEIENKQNT